MFLFYTKSRLKHFIHFINRIIGASSKFPRIFVLRIFVSIEVALKDEEKKLKEFMNNRDVIDIFGQYLNGNKNMIIGKARQTGKSNIASHLSNNQYNSKCWNWIYSNFC